MAHIKCRYFEYRCGVGDYGYSQKRCEYPQQNDGCKYFKDHWFEEDKQMWAITEICVNAYRSYTEFEGDYKKYEVDDFELWIPRRHIDTDYIEYLEIDNRIIIDRTDSNG